MTNNFSIRVRGAVISSSLLLIQHVTLWELRNRLPLVARYALGTLAIGAGVSYCAAERREWRVAGDFWSCVVLGGGLVIAAHLIREMQEQPVDRLLKRALRGDHGTRGTTTRYD